MKISLALLSRRDNHHFGTIAKMASLIVAAFPSGPPSHPDCRATPWSATRTHASIYPSRQTIQRPRQSLASGAYGKFEIRPTPNWRELLSAAEPEVLSEPRNIVMAGPEPSKSRHKTFARQ